MKIRPENFPPDFSDEIAGAFAVAVTLRIEDGEIIAELLNPLKAVYAEKDGYFSVQLLNDYENIVAG